MTSQRRCRLSSTYECSDCTNLDRGRRTAEVKMVAIKLMERGCRWPRNASCEPFIEVISLEQSDGDGVWRPAKYWLVMSIGKPQVTMVRNI